MWYQLPLVDAVASTFHGRGRAAGSNFKMAYTPFDVGLTTF
jgi:hypothetical protein